MVHGIARYENVTPHIVPEGAPIAETILLPGDPRRAQFIAENFLDSVEAIAPEYAGELDLATVPSEKFTPQGHVQFNAVRGALGFTGSYRGVPVSVMATGMGMPSMGIYSWELIHQFGARRLVRVGTCGALADDLRLHDIILVQATCTDSNFVVQFDTPGSFAPIGSYNLLAAAAQAAHRTELPVHVGSVVTTDLFYHPDATVNERWRAMGVLAVEMETAALYTTAAAAGVEALSIVTVSDHIFRGEVTTAEEREHGLSRMIRLGLDAAVSEER